LIELDVATRLALLPKYERLYKFKILIVIFVEILIGSRPFKIKFNSMVCNICMRITIIPDENFKSLLFSLIVGFIQLN
jgi:hypothetical protein